MIGLLLAALLAQEPDAPAPGALRMALVCLRSEASDLPDPAAARKVLQRNLDRHLAFIDRAAERRADFVGFPELSLNGYRFGPHVLWLAVDGPEVRRLAEKAAEKKLYVSAGLAERDADGRRWNTQIVIGPDGRLVGRQAKIWLTAEKGHVEGATERAVVEVKGHRMGVSICADGSDYGNLKALVDRGATLIYAPHCNSTGSTTSGWYKFRARWGGPAGAERVELPTSNDGPKATMPAGGWIATLKVHAALHNHAGRYGDVVPPPSDPAAPERWAGGAWFIGPDGATLAQVPSSAKREDSVERLLIHDVPPPK
jgi:predicted amidohydrolase